MIMNRTFYLDGPVVLNGLHNLRILNCKFVCKLKSEEPFVTIGDCSNLMICGCIFNTYDYERALR